MHTQARTFVYISAMDTLINFTATNSEIKDA